MADSTPNHRWFHLTPDRFVVVLLAVECLIWLSERFPWPTWHKGYAVLCEMAGLTAAMILMLFWFLVTLLFRWRFQFSIRSLLILAVVVAIPCSWLAVEMKDARRQKETVEKLGGEVNYDWEFNAMSRQLPNIQPPEPAWLRSLLGNDFFGQVVGVHLEDTQVRDAGLEYLKRLDHLEELWLNYSQSTDAGLEHIKGLHHLNLLLLERGLTVSESEELHKTLPNCIIEEFQRLPQKSLR